MARSRRVGDPARELPAEPDPVRNRLFDLGGRTAVDPDMPGRSVKQCGAGVVFDQFVAADQASQRARGLEEGVMAGARLRSGYGVCLTLDDRADICIGPSPRQSHRPLRFGRRGRGQLRVSAAEISAVVQLVQISDLVGSGVGLPGPAWRLWSCVSHRRCVAHTPTPQLRQIPTAAVVVPATWQS